MSARGINPLYAQLRELRRAARLTLTEAAEQLHVTPAALGAWERGDRHPPIDRLDLVFGFYGRELRAVPMGAVLLDPAEPAPGVVLTDEQMVAQLRRVAAQLEARAPLGGAL